MGKPHEELEAWKVGMTLAQTVYKMTADFPREERYGLSQQMRRAAVSIPSNIAEGAARNHPRENVQFLAVSRGSLAELETQLKLAASLGFIESTDELLVLTDRTGRLLTGLHKKWSMR